MSRPIRILYLIDELREPGGAERALLRIVRLLPRDRFQPSVLTYAINPDLEDLRWLDCPIQVYPLRRIYGWNGLKLALRLRRLIRAEGIDIVHTFFESSDIWGGLTAKMSKQLVLISSRRDLGFRYHAWHRWMYRVLAPLFDQVQAVSEQVREYVLRADRLDPADVVTIPNGIELDRAAPSATPAAVRARFGLGAAWPLITCLAHVRRIKGLDVLVRAAEAVCGEFPSARFLLAGAILEHDYWGDLKSLVARSGLADNVRFLGRVADVFSLLAASDVFLLPSRSEGMSNAVLEAMACSLPVVASRVGGNIEMVCDGETGYLTPVGDSGAVSERLLELLRNPARAKEMGRAGRRRVERRYSMDAVMRHLIGEYERLAASRPGRHPSQAPGL